MQYDKVFVDTNVLMEYGQKIFDKSNKVYICGIILQEIDKHKISINEEKRFKARQATRAIEQNEKLGKVEYIVKDFGMYSMPSYFDMGSPDNKILSIAKDVCNTDDEILVLSNDLNFRQKCKVLNIPCMKFGEEINDEIYTGYKIIDLTENELANWYETEIKVNLWNLHINEYVLFKVNGDIVDKYKWTEKGFVGINTKAFKSIYFPDFKPKDIYQMLAMDSLHTSDLTLLFGKAGTAKTYASLAWIMQGIHTNKIGKCVVIFNPAKLRNNEQLGFYSGDRNQKLLQNSIGGILSSKLGDMTMVETLINQGKLMIIPTSDIRGIEISSNDCIFVTEAQNTDAYTMRTIIQRAKEGCKIIIEGDMLEQQDIKSCINGMMRVIEIFKGTKYFSCVKLEKIYRSPLAEIAQNI
jgi:predicted ribonuclease YlaK